MGVMLILIWWPSRRKSSPFRWKHSIVFISIFLTLADFVYFYALTDPDAMISVVSMVRRGSVLVSFAIGALIFKEKNLKSKTVDLIFVLLSMICLWIGSNWESQTYKPCNASLHLWCTTFENGNIICSQAIQSLPIHSLHEIAIRQFIRPEIIATEDIPTGLYIIAYTTNSQKSKSIKYLKPWNPSWLFY